jgi:hypothetical protein
MEKADSIIRFLDALWIVVIWKNQLGSYSAALVKREDFLNDGNESIFETNENRITDDSTPTKALERLAEKPLGNIIDNYEANQ